MAEMNRQWLLRRRPEGMVGVEDFEYREAPIPTPQDGEVLVRSLYFGYDASQRIWITEHGGYLTPVGIGEPMRTMGIGQEKYMNICTKMLHVQGILLLFYRDRLQAGIETLARWIAEGKIHVEEEIVEGFEHAPRLLPLPFSGKNPGKLILKVADPS